MSQKQAQKEPSICIKREAHQNQQIQYICLEEGCQDNRQLCRECVSESHRKHKVGVIDKLISPMNRLNMNSYHEDSIQDYCFFHDLIKSIQDEWEKMNIIFLETMETLKSGVIMQLESLMNTFTNQQIDHTYDIFINNNSRIKDVNDCVQTLNFLEKFHFQSVEQVKKKAEKLTSRVIRSIRSTADSVKKSLAKMTSYNQRVDFKSHFDNSRRKDNEIKQKSEQQKHNQPETQKQELQEHDDSSIQNNQRSNAKSQKKDTPQQILQTNKRQIQYQNQQRKIITKYK